MSTYLITGVAGFIGSRTAEILLEEGHTVVGIDNMSGAPDLKMTLSRLSPLEQFPTFEFQFMDVESESGMQKLLAKCAPDAVLHLAGKAGVRSSMETPQAYMATNAMGTLNLLEAMRGTGLKKIVFASTSSLYAGHPVPFDENLPVNSPISPYAASKKAAEMMCHAYHHLYQMDVSILRFFTVYGPKGRPDMAIYKFIKSIVEGAPINLFGDGSQSRDFTFVDDISRGIIAAVGNVGYEVFNLGAGRKPVSLLEVIRHIEMLTGKKAELVFHPFHEADMDVTWSNVAKSQRVLHWEAKYSLEEGLKQTIRWFEDSKSRFEAQLSPIQNVHHNLFKRLSIERHAKY